MLVNNVYFRREKGAAPEGCKERRVQKKTPLSYVLAPAADGANGGTQDGGNGGSQSGGTNQVGGTNTGGSGGDDDERPGAGG